MEHTIATLLESRNKHDWHTVRPYTVFGDGFIVRKTLLASNLIISLLRFWLQQQHRLFQSVDDYRDYREGQQSKVKSAFTPTSRQVD